MNVSSLAVMIQSAALHFYGGPNACRIPLSDKHAMLSHHEDIWTETPTTTNDDELTARPV